MRNVRSADNSVEDVVIFPAVEADDDDWPEGGRRRRGRRVTVVSADGGGEGEAKAAARQRLAQKFYKYVHRTLVYMSLVVGHWKEKKYLDQRLFSESCCGFNCNSVGQLAKISSFESTLCELWER